MFAQLNMFTGPAGYTVLGTRKPEKPFRARKHCPTTRSVVGYMAVHTSSVRGDTHGRGGLAGRCGAVSTVAGKSLLVPRLRISHCSLVHSTALVVRNLKACTDIHHLV